MSTAKAKKLAWNFNGHEWWPDGLRATRVYPNEDGSFHWETPKRTHISDFLEGDALSLLEAKAAVAKALEESEATDAQTR